MLVKFSVDEYTAHHPAVFVDSTSTLNLLADVPTTSLTVVSADVVLANSFDTDASSSGTMLGRRWSN